MSNPSLGFGLIYGGKLVYSEVLVYEGIYQVSFNSKPVAEIAYGFDFRWLLSAGTILPQCTIDEIGSRIENWFE